MRFKKRFDLVRDRDGYDVYMCPQQYEIADLLATHWGGGDRPAEAALKRLSGKFLEVRHVEAQVDGRIYEGVYARERTDSREFAVIRTDDEAPAFEVYARDPKTTKQTTNKKATIKVEQKTIEMGKVGQITPLPELK